MRIFCLGGAGRICREAILDLVLFSNASRITVSDVDEAAAHEVVSWLNDPRVDFVPTDVRQRSDTVAKMRGYDVVMDGTTIALNGLSTACIAEAGCHGINLNGFGEEEASDPVFRAHGRTCVPGFGMTPGTTQMMVMHAAAQLDTVEIARVSHGAFRPIAFSAAITETTTYEYDPTLPSRVVFEDGEFKQVPPFARPPCSRNSRDGSSSFTSGLTNLRAPAHKPGNSNRQRLQSRHLDPTLGNSPNPHQRNEDPTGRF